MLSSNIQSRSFFMKMDSKSGATLAAAAATLFLAGVAVSTSTPADAAQGKCMAVNACKGQSACKSAGNACKGMNACKSNGFVVMSEAACKAKGGVMAKG
jgi:hypothetical protein